jgi:hypothetical protein
MLATEIPILCRKANSPEMSFERFASLPDVFQQSDKGVEERMDFFRETNLLAVGSGPRNTDLPLNLKQNQVCPNFGVGLMIIRVLYGLQCIRGFDVENRLGFRNRVIVLCIV